MSPRITGGEPVKKIVQLTDADMKAITSLSSAGLADLDPREINKQAALNAIVSLRKKQGGTPGQRYAAWAETHRDAMNSTNPRVRKEWEKANASYLQTVMNASPGSSTVHTNSSMANLSTQYGNDDYIGEMLCPPVLTAKKSDVFYTYNKQDRLALPTDDVIADDGEAPEIVERRSTDSYACTDRGYKNYIAANAVANQDAPLNELFDLTEALVEARHFRREMRIATTLQTAANYATGNKATLTGADQWNSASGGNPIKNLQTGTAALWRGRAPAMTKGFSGLDEFLVLSRHPDILGLFQYNGSSPGLATPMMIANFLGWDDYLVGAARKDTAVEGDSASYSRIWSGFFGILRVANRASIRSATFAMTLRWTMPGVPGANQGILSQQWFDQTKGLGGCHYAKVGESEAHKVQANDTGYLFTSPIA